MMIENWCTVQGPALAAAQPKFPEGIADRDADCWESLLAIADAGGGPWPQRGRAAAIAMVARGADRTRTAGVQLLADLREVFGASEKLASSTILERLRDLPESAWNDVRGKPLDQRGLSWRLKKYGVKPKLLRLPSGPVLRGYEAADLHDAWARYLPFPEQALHPLQALQTPSVTASVTEKPAEHSQKTDPVTDVTDVTGNPDKAGDVTDNDPFTVFKDPSLRLKLGG